MNAFKITSAGVLRDGKYTITHVEGGFDSAFFGIVFDLFDPTFLAGASALLSQNDEDES